MLDRTIDLVMDLAKVVGIGLLVVAVSLLGKWLTAVGPGQAALTNESDNRGRHVSESVERR
jgi:hypothetical protein